MSRPLVVSYGAGVDSTALLVGLHQEGIRPDLILFADTGDEKPETYAYLPVIAAWLDRVGFPPVTVVKNPRPRSGDLSLSDSCLRLGTLPALAYGKHQCALVWKIAPQMAFLKRWPPAIQARSLGQPVTVMIGYDSSPRDTARRYRAEGKAMPGCDNAFPLIAWGWNRDDCMREIARVGLPLPVKSACFHCPASKPQEIAALRTTSPDLYAKAILMERTARAKGLRRIAGLGRRFSWESVSRVPAQMSLFRGGEP